MKLTSAWRAVAAAAPLHHPVLAPVFALTSKFYHPDIDMPGPETLSQASAFVVAGTSRSQWSAGAPLHVIVSHHVVQPWRYPKYYPVEKYPFLQLLCDEHVQCHLSLHDQAGVTLFSVPLKQRVFAHPSRDVAVMSLVDVTELREAWARHTSGDPDNLHHSFASTPCAEGQPLLIRGHVLRPHVLPMQVPACVMGSTASGQTFARPAEELEMGMCGGPALDGEGRVLGVLEGVVPKPAPPAGLADGLDGSGDASVQQKARRLLGGAGSIVCNHDIREVIAVAEAWEQ